MKRIKILTMVALSIVSLGANNCASKNADAVATPATSTFSPVCTPTETIKLSINAPKTIAADSCIAIKGIIHIIGTTLTIGAGTTILADTSTLTALVIDQGSTIIAVGTATKPIVMTSAANVGSRSPSDWGGIVIHGKSPTAGPNGGTTLSTLYPNTEILTGPYGGSSTNDSSGILQYVRVEFAGSLVAANAEYNGFFLAGVGSGTTIDHIQAHRGSDDGIEIFGGRVNINYAVFSANQDDQFDLDEGWQGSAHNIVLAPANDCDHAIEYDGTATGWTDNTKATNAVFSNFTIVGVTDKVKQGGIAVRDQGALQLYNSYIANFKSNYFISSNRVAETVATSTTESFSSNYLEGIVNASGTALTPDTMGCYADYPGNTLKCTATVAIATLFPDGATNFNVGNTTAIPAMSKLTAPAAGSFWGQTNGVSEFIPATPITLATYVDPPAAQNGTDLAIATYVGAFSSSSDTWANTWTAFPAN